MEDLKNSKEIINRIREDYLKKFNTFMETAKLENTYVGTIESLRHTHYKGVGPIPSEIYIKLHWVEPYIDGVIKDAQGKWCTIQSNTEDDFLVRVDQLTTRDLVRLYQALIDGQKKKSTED